MKVSHRRLSWFEFFNKKIYLKGNPVEKKVGAWNFPWKLLCINITLCYSTVILSIDGVINGIQNISLYTKVWFVWPSFFKLKLKITKFIYFIFYFWNQLFLVSENFYVRECFYGRDDDSKTVDNLRWYLGPCSLLWYGWSWEWAIWMGGGWHGRMGICMRNEGCGWSGRYA